MPIASKLLYFQRRPSPAPPPDPAPELTAHRRRLSRDASGRRHRQVQEHVQGNKRDTAKCGLSAGNIVEHMGSMGSSSRLYRSVSDHGRLPDAVQQARERLLQRLNSVDLSGRRQNTSSSSETILAGVAQGVSTPADGILGSVTNCFQAGASIPACKLHESTAESFGIAEKCTLITLCSDPVPDHAEAACDRASDNGERKGPSVDCSICLERCADMDGLIQLRCKHIFHSACLERWLRSRSDCPYCRASVLLPSNGR